MHDSDSKAVNVLLCSILKHSPGSAATEMMELGHFCEDHEKQAPNFEAPESKNLRLFNAKLLKTTHVHLA